MEFLNDLLLLPYYSFNYLFSIIVWVILLSYVLNMYDRWDFPNPMTDFFYNCYELFNVEKYSIAYASLFGFIALSGLTYKLCCNKKKRVNDYDEIE